jgi:uncharacterized protein (DUF924 family)
MPFMHSEVLADQERGVVLVRDLVEGGDKFNRDNYDSAIKHRDIIARFGRFPHRNEVLGRESTAEELEFLQDPDSSF